MIRHSATITRSALASFLVLGTMSAVALAGDLSKYRNFRFGTDLGTVTKQADADPSQVKVIQRRPALIQELAWRPQSPGSLVETEPAKEVVFTFYNGELFRIVVNYDRYETEGLTVDDFVEAISAVYGPAVRLTIPLKAETGSYGDEEEVLAQWEDTQFRFALIRSSYGPTFKLSGVLKRLEAPVQAATLEAKRLDDQEAPQRETARIASEEAAANAGLAKARLANKPKFRP